MTEETEVSPIESTLLLRHEDFDELLNIAAQRGAERCLAHLGLENGHAAKDIRELRDKNVPADVGVVGSVKDLLPPLTELIEKRSYPEWFKQINLRRKIPHEYLITVRSTGYLLVDPEHTAIVLE